MISTHELARMCGVSQGTVDRALHGRPGVSAATRARILATAEAQGFIANPVPREMMGLTASALVGIVAFERALQRPFFMDLFAALSPALRAVGRVPSLWLVGSEGMATAVREVAARRPQAIVLVRPPPDLVLTAPLVQAQPVVSLVTPCATPGVANLLPNERRVGQAATRHLLDLGHRAVVHVAGGPLPHWAREERAAGYTAAMVEAGLTPQVLWDVLDDTGVLVDRLLSLRPTAVFCHNDRLALRLQQALRPRGVRVPEDLSMIGVDHSAIMSSLGVGPTSVPYPVEAIAAQVMASINHERAPAWPEPVVANVGVTARPR